MDIDSIVQLINGVGFPIVASGAMFWLTVNIMQQQRKTLKSIEDALDNNTRVLSELYRKMD